MRGSDFNMGKVKDTLQQPVYCAEKLLPGKHPGQSLLWSVRGGKTVPFLPCGSEMMSE